MKGKSDARRQKFFFFFQAEDGIRDIGVTGVQTCALPIYISVFKYSSQLELLRLVIIYLQLCLFSSGIS